MLKIAAIAIVFCALGMESVPTLSQADAKIAASQSQSTANRSSETSVVSPIGNQTANNPRKDRDDKPHDWHRFVSWPEGITAWFIMLTLGAIIWQAWETRKAAEATRDSAIAAEQSVKVVMNAERAWVTIAPGIMSPKLYPSWEQGTPYPADPEKLNMVRHQLPLLIRNVGKSPAQMVEFACRYIRIASMASLPAEPDYGPLQSQGGHWIIPNDAHNATTDLETDNGILYERHVKDIEFRQSFLFAFGILRYRDVHRNLHETRFAFIYNFPMPGVLAADGTKITPRFWKDGPSRYNYAD